MLLCCCKYDEQRQFPENRPPVVASLLRTMNDCGCPDTEEILLLETFEKKKKKNERKGKEEDHISGCV